MTPSDRPRRIVRPWASGAGASYVRTVPDTGATGGAASYDSGFPPVTFQSTASGGVPPDGRDFNGVLLDVSANARWSAAGGFPAFDATFAAAIGGYPQGAILQSTTIGRLWQSTANNNTTDPDGGSAANWIAVTASFGTAANAITYPDGKIDQWGRVDYSSTGEPVVAVALATAYTAGDYNISLTPKINGASQLMDTWVQIIQNTITTGGFSVQYQRGQNGGNPGLDGFYWRTIGK